MPFRRSARNITKDLHGAVSYTQIADATPDTPHRGMRVRSPTSRDLDVSFFSPGERAGTF
jgi:hypothetical protein